MLEKLLICDCKSNQNLLESVSVMSSNEDESDTSDDYSEYSFSNENTDEDAESREQLDNNNIDPNPYLPSDVMQEVISHVKDKGSFMNCMLLNRDIREIMFSTKAIMRNILYNFSDEFGDSKLKKVSKFLEVRGRCIRCVKITMSVQNGEFIWNILSKTLNLEELTFDVLELNPPEPNERPMLSKVKSDDKVELSNLKYLNIDTRIFNTFLKSTKPTINSLKTLVLSVSFYGSEDEVIMTKFICQQNELKELRILGIHEIYWRQAQFPLQDITTDASFKLKKFEISSDHRSNSLKNFLKIQVKNLTELSFGFLPAVECIEPFFYSENLGILKQMKLNLRYEREFLPNDYVNWQKEVLRFVNIYLNGPPPDFPYAVHLKCNHIAESNICCDKIVELYVKELNIKHQKPKFPDVKILKIIKFEDNNLWRQFTANFKNVEKIRINEVEINGNIAYILWNLNFFDKLKHFDFGYYPESNYNNKFIVDLELKKITASTHIVRSYKEYFEILMEKFVDYEFIEVCVHVNKRPGKWEKIRLKSPEKSNANNSIGFINHVYSQKLDIKEFLAKEEDEDDESDLNHHPKRMRQTIDGQDS